MTTDDQLRWFEDGFRTGLYTEDDKDIRWLVDEVRRLQEQVDDMKLGESVVLTDLAAARAEVARLRDLTDAAKNILQSVEKASPVEIRAWLAALEKTR